MGTKYPGIAASGYNSSPPVDDGSATEANKVKWSTIKTKLSDVLKTFIEAVNAALVTALDKSCRTISASDSAAASDHDRTIQVTTSSVAITLADAATMGAGYTVSIANQSTGSISVALATATNTIDTVTNATQTIEAKETRRYIVNTETTGYISSSRYGAVADLSEDTSPDLGADYVETYDSSTTRRKKVLLGRIAAGVLMTEQTPTATSICTFTGIPSWAKKVTVMFDGVSTDGTGALSIQIGDSGGLENTGYTSTSARLTDSAAVSVSSSTTAFALNTGGNAGNLVSGALVFTLQDSASFTWALQGSLAVVTGATHAVTAAGAKALSAALTQLAIITADAFDAGSISILYE